MNPLYKGLEPQPDTFYKCINFYGDDGIEYCTPDGSTLVFAKDTLEIPYPFPDVYVFTQVYDRQSQIPPEAIPREVSVCDRMSVCCISPGDESFGPGEGVWKGVQVHVQSS